MLPILGLLGACTDIGGAPKGVATNPGTDTTAPTDDSGTPTDPDTGTAPTDTTDTDTPTDSVPDSGTTTGSALTAADCFGAIWGSSPPVDYDQFGPVLGSHCMGTNHQDITAPGRVVFVGDSITVGSPPTATEDWYRNVLTDTFVDRYGLEAPSWEWQNVNLVDGTTYVQESGDFASCAKYGARTDDLLRDNTQLATCLPEDKRDLPTLVVMTIGGNDYYSLLEDIAAGVDDATVASTFADATGLLRDAATYVADQRANYPNGLWLVFANTYDFTDADAAEDMARCPGAGLINLDEPLRDASLWPVAAAAQEEYVSIAVDTQTDVVFLGETFCGHGYAYDEASGRCYRGSGAELYLDFTCMHPAEAGHRALADLVLAVVDE